MEFEKSFLQEFEGETVYDRITGTGRWSIHRERVFKHEGRFFRTVYSHGATESQDEAPYEYSPDMIECPEVFPVEQTITAYLAAPSPGRGGSA